MDTLSIIGWSFAGLFAFGAVAFLIWMAYFNSNKD